MPNVEFPNGLPRGGARFLRKIGLHINLRKQAGHIRVCQWRRLELAEHLVFLLPDLFHVFSDYRARKVITAQDAGKKLDGGLKLLRDHLIRT